jgi:hypothetical protein
MAMAKNVDFNQPSISDIFYAYQKQEMEIFNHGDTEPTEIPEIPADRIDAMLEERGNAYGDFPWLSKIAQDLKDVISDHASNASDNLGNDHREALDMICTKIARILNGDPDHKDSWDDIAGYAKLVSNRIAKDNSQKAAK